MKIKIWADDGSFERNRDVVVYEITETNQENSRNLGVMVDVRKPAKVVIEDQIFVGQGLRFVNT